jgi:hypothetical protein
MLAAAPDASILERWERSSPLLFKEGWHAKRAGVVTRETATSHRFAQSAFITDPDGARRLERKGHRPSPTSPLSQEKI